MDITSSSIENSFSDAVPLHMKITVTEPEKHGDGMKAFATYKVTTKSTALGGEEIYVRRRFSDFLWLRTQLVEQNPQLLVPTLPGVFTSKYLQRFSESFLEKRRRSLELFLLRIASHPGLVSSPALDTFLHAKEWALKTAQDADDSGALSYVLKKLTKSNWSSSMSESDPEGEKLTNLREYFVKFQEQVTNIHALLGKSRSSSKAFGAGLAEVGPALSLLAQLETELCEGLTRTGKVMKDDSLKLLNEEAEHEEFNVSETLLEYALMAHAAMDVLKYRDQKAVTYEETLTLLQTLKEELEKAKVAANTPEETKSTWTKLREKAGVDAATRVKVLEDRIIETEKLLGDQKADLARTTLVLIDEMEKFHIWKLKDFKGMLLDYIHFQIQMHKRAQAAWENVIPAIEGVTKSKRNTWWVGRNN